ncbi:hypothetical protein CC2G_004557 [Coprinopsis cinerea AmutBmut pab1-1]|nr:hypothetical protein CC2G_004557 [Coprinopsis cinerea AmutBmut pab1-1]
MTSHHCRYIHWILGITISTALSMNSMIEGIECLWLGAPVSPRRPLKAKETHPFRSWSINMAYNHNMFNGGNGFPNAQTGFNLQNMSSPVVAHGQRPYHPPSGVQGRYSPSLGYHVQAAPARLPKRHDEDVYEETVGLQPVFYPQDLDYLVQQSTPAISFTAPNMDRRVLPSGLPAISFSFLPSVSQDVEFPCFFPFTSLPIIPLLFILLLSPTSHQLYV